jgi:hypothetical protein
MIYDFSDDKNSKNRDLTTYIDRYVVKHLSETLDMREWPDFILVLGVMFYCLAWLFENFCKMFVYRRTRGYFSKVNMVITLVQNRRRLSRFWAVF